MPLNYLGPHEDRIALVQPGTRWKPRVQAEARQHLPHVMIVSRHDVSGLSALEARVYLEPVSGTGTDKARPRKSVSVKSLLGTYMREDEKFREPEKPAAPRTKGDLLHARLSMLEARVQHLEFELGVRAGDGRG
jgi:hypothetical protein